MGSNASEKPHAVCVPFPAQGHMNPMLMVAKLLHTHGFHITFVLTEFNQRRLLRSSGEEAVSGLQDFRFETIPDGLPFSDDDATQDVLKLCDSTSKTCLPHFRRLLSQLNSKTGQPAVSCIVSDAIMTFTLDAARDLGIPEVLFWTGGACSYIAYMYYRDLIDRGLIPLKNIEDMSNGFLDREVDWATGLMKGIRLKDFPSFIRTVDANDVMLRFVIHEISRPTMASAFFLNTIEALEQPALSALEKILPPIYSIGPLSLLTRRKIPADSPLAAIGTSLWKKEDSCFEWLRERDPGSVVYVNFGSITVMSEEQLVEFAWGLSNSGYDFLWVIRPDVVKGEASVLPVEFVEETKERGLMVSWCAQEEVLMHSSVGVFLTHSGWNSTIESIAGGVPMICWPFFADQQTNCRYACEEWGVGMETGGGNVRREEMERLIREMMGGNEKGKGIRKKAAEWKEIAVKDSGPQGVSEANFVRMVNGVLRGSKGVVD